MTPRLGDAKFSLASPYLGFEESGMEINLGTERIVQIQATYTLADVEEAAAKKRVEAFGQVARLF